MFGVTVNNGDAIVRVTYGCVDVAAGGGTVSVGPEQQISVTAGGTVAADEIERAQLSEDDRARSRRLVSALPDLDVGPPNPGGSDALAAVIQKDTLVVAVDPVGSSEARLGSEFAESWPSNIHTPMGPQCAVADVTPQGTRILSGTQGAYQTRRYGRATWRLQSLLRRPVDPASWRV